jgi:hypothetical protein
MREMFSGEMINNQESPKYKEAITKIDEAFDSFVVNNKETEERNNLDNAK